MLETRGPGLALLICAIGGCASGAEIQDVLSTRCSFLITLWAPGAAETKTVQMVYEREVWNHLMELKSIDCFSLTMFLFYPRI